MKKIKTLAVVFSLSLLIAFISIGGGEVGNGGGYAIKIAGIPGLHLLDFVDTGAKKNLYMSVGAKNLLTEQEQGILSSVLHPLFDFANHKYLGSTSERFYLKKMFDEAPRRLEKEEVLKLVGTKLTELRDMIKTLGLSYPVDEVIRNIDRDRFNWVKHNVPCLDVLDEVNSKERKLVQVAYRMKKYIRFCQEAYTLKVPDFAGLILHEMIYAAHNAKSATKELVGIMFKPVMAKGGEKLQLELGPILEELRADLKAGIKRSANPGEYPLPFPGLYCLNPKGPSSTKNCPHSVKTIETDEDGYLEEFKVVLDRPAVGLKLVSSLHCDRDGVCRMSDFHDRVVRYIHVNSPTSITDYVKGKNPIKYYLIGSKPK